MGELSELDEDLRRRLVEALGRAQPSVAEAWGEVVARCGAATDAGDELGDAQSWEAVLLHERALAYVPLIVVDARISAELQRELLEQMRARARRAVGPDDGRARHFVSYAMEDGRERKQEIVRWLSNRVHAFVFADESMPSGTVWREALCHQLLLASDVNLVWTDGASRSRWVRWEVEYARALNRMASGGASYDDEVRPRIRPEGDGPRDDPLVRDLNIASPTTRSGRVHWQLTMAWVASLVLLSWSRSRSWALVLQGWLGLLAFVGGALVMLHYFGSRPLKQHVAKAASFLKDASAKERFELSERVIKGIYGPRLLTVRGIGISALVSAILVSPVLLTLSATVPNRPLVDLVLDSYGQGRWSYLLLLAVLTIAMDFVSLAVTKAIVEWLSDDEKSPSMARIVTGLGVDGSIAVALIVVSIYWSSRDALGISSLTGRELAIFEVIGVTLWNLASGGIDPVNMLDSGVPTFFLGSLLWAGSAAVPSMLHIGLLVIGWVLRRGERVSAWLARVLHDVNEDLRGPAGIVYVGAVLVTGLAVVGRFSRVVEGASPPMWVEPVVGSGLCVSDREITQSWWQEIATSDRGRSMSLPARPSTFRGAQLPVETISWCESLRSLNAWSANDGLEPVYCEASTQDEDCRRPGVGWYRRYELRGCETNVPIVRRPGVSGYRLPTYREWRAALAASKPEGAWYAVNAGYQTHAFERSGELQALVGNVSEFVETDDDLAGTVEDGMVRGSVVGNSWFFGMKRHEIEHHHRQGSSRDGERLRGPVILSLPKPAEVRQAAIFGLRAVIDVGPSGCPR